MRYSKTNFIFVFCTSNMTWKSKLGPLAPGIGRFMTRTYKSDLKFLILPILVTVPHRPVGYGPASGCFMLISLFGVY